MSCCSCDECATEKTEDKEFAYFSGLLTGRKNERERIIKLLDEQSNCFHKTGVGTVAGIDDVICNCDAIALIKGHNK
jgi:hypothetical protein